MDDVVVAGVVVGLRAQYPAVKAHSWVGRSFLVQPLERSGHHTTTPGATVCRRIGR